MCDSKIFDFDCVLTRVVRKKRNSDIVDFGKLKLVVDFFYLFVEKGACETAGMLSKKRLNVF